ncbi:hypothetical protein SAMN06297251_104307 [Fulvimarina manganoxydans]|uniref:Uncharacterized protein n=1 Tax=Fulvimarina manganoxydans TaxID=937218 RepID=A0A1W2AM83_9HYPH|nr:hypothetical protein [Fulvimarina manganoxydans]MEE2952287.1 hypothetical protein [Pseudomonadota bacterium]SMC61773.1 hypothetical protein SAMN06297251_104307 [Fulvimarina manganoxydans]
MLAALFVLAFFSPLAFIYGRWRARGLKSRQPSLAKRLVALLPMPLILCLCATVAIIWENEGAARNRAALLGQDAHSLLATGNGVLDGLMTIARWLGQLELILFMIALPYLLGTLISATLLVLDARGTIILAPLESEEVTPETPQTPQGD